MLTMYQPCRCCLDLDLECVCEFGLEKEIADKFQSSEAEKNVLQGKQRFTKFETEMIFQHFKHFMDNETVPKKEDILHFMTKINVGHVHIR